MRLGKRRLIVIFMTNVSRPLLIQAAQDQTPLDPIWISQFVLISETAIIRQVKSL